MTPSPLRPVSWILALLIVLSLGSAVTAEVREGTYLDIRYNDLLLGGLEGGLNLRIVEGSELLLNGEPSSAKELPPGKPAYADYDPKTGSVRRLEVIAPEGWSSSDALFRLSLGHRYGENPERPFRRGEVLKFEVRAQPNQEIVCHLVGFTAPLKTREIRPGLYRCSLPVPDRLNLRHAYAYASNGEDRIFGPRFQLAPSPPQVLQLGELEDSLYLRYRSRGSWLRKASLWVNDQLVTGLQTGSETVLSPPLNLSEGAHRARWRLLDQAGNETLQDFTFRRD